MKRRRKIPELLGQLVRTRARDRCEYCRLPQVLQNGRFHVDHIHPFSKLGKTVLENLALACIACSLHKSAKEKRTDWETDKQVRLYNPRKDRWVEHFRWSESWHLIGKTPVGRATVDALQINIPRLVQIRCRHAEFGFFP